MKTMKNVLMILLGAALVLSLAGVGAVAADTYRDGAWVDGGDSDIIVSYSIGASYSVTIPPDVTLSPEGTSSPKLNVQATLNPSSTLIVNVTSANGWYMVFTDNNEKKIPYTLTIGGQTVSISGSKGQVVLHRLIESGNVDLTMAFATSTYNPTSLPAGTYTDTLSFTVTQTSTTGTTPEGEATTGTTPEGEATTGTTPEGEATTGTTPEGEA